VREREGTLGAPVEPAETTRVVEFNDVEALERELGEEDVACVLAEPALTNIGIVLPQPGYHEALRNATRRTGTLLIIDETHTICAGPGGYTAAYGLEPDLLTIGKPIAGGIPAAAYGFSEDVAGRVDAAIPEREAAAGGDEALDRFIHLYALNRGILLTPFHNMALMSPATVEADVDRHTEVFDAAARELT